MKKTSGSDCGRWSGNENVKESESGRENEREKGSEGGEKKSEVYCCGV